MAATSNIIVLPSIYRSRRTFAEDYARDGLLEREDELNSHLASLEVCLETAKDFFQSQLQPIEALIREAKAQLNALSSEIEKS